MMRRTHSTLLFVVAVWMRLIGTVVDASQSCDGSGDCGDVDNRPNLLFILVDDMRFDDFGLSGVAPLSDLDTPAIDRIGREGAYFENAFAVTPLCSPSRGSILTGLYPHAHGIVDNQNRSQHSHTLETYPRMLQEAGYETAFVGKWHMGNDPSARPGFDYWLCLEGQGIAEDPVLYEQRSGDSLKKITTSGYVTDILTDKSINFIEANHARETRRPFALYLSHKALHPNFMQLDDGTKIDIGDGGFVSAPRHRHLFDNTPVKRRQNAFIPPEQSGKGALARPIEGLEPMSPETSTPDKVVKDRLRMLMGVEDSTARLFDSLETLGNLDSTAILFTGDHGYWYGEHCLNEERRLPYEEGLRIPLLLRYPPVVRPGQRVSQMALTVDIAPTFLDLARVAPPRPLHGQSLMPLVDEGRTPLWRNSFLVEYYTDVVFPRMHRMGYHAVRSERYLFLRFLEDEVAHLDELYDLENDPFELTNIASLPSAQAALHSLETELERLRSVLGWSS